MSPENSYHSRTIYNALDFLGDIGGLADALRYIGQLLIWLISGNNVSQYLILNIFRKDRSKDKLTFSDKTNIRKTINVIKN